MPTVSDPGYGLVAESGGAGRGDAIPGPSAVVTALAVAGLPTDRFTFEGFLPRKPGERRGGRPSGPRRRAAHDGVLRGPSRLAETLAAMADTSAQAGAGVCRELTKLHQEVVRGGVAELAAWAADGVRGEIVVVVAGATVREVTPEDALAQVQRSWPTASA